MAYHVQLSPLPPTFITCSYTVVGFMGFGRVSYPAALAAAFIEGWIFILVSVTGAPAGPSWA